MEKQQSGTPGAGPSHPAAAVTAYGEDTDECQQAAQAAALIQHGRATASRAIDKPSTAHIDVSWMSDDELNRWLTVDDDGRMGATTEEVHRLFGAMWDALKEVKANREVVMLGFMNDPAMPPDWVTAVAALPLEEEK